MTLSIPIIFPGDEITLLQHVCYGNNGYVTPLANGLNSAVRTFRIEGFADFHFPELARPETSVYVNGPRDRDEHQAAPALRHTSFPFPIKNSQAP